MDKKSETDHQTLCRKLFGHVMFIGIPLLVVLAYFLDFSKATRSVLIVFLSLPYATALILELFWFSSATKLLFKRNLAIYSVATSLIVTVIVELLTHKNNCMSEFLFAMGGSLSGIVGGSFLNRISRV